MRVPTRFASLLAVALLFSGAVLAQQTKSIPVVTQVQGATFYRTSVTISNGNPSITTPVNLLFSYRSPVDQTFQTAAVTLPFLGPRHIVFFEDVVQAFKNASVIRIQDANADLFGTLLVTFTALPSGIGNRFEAAAVARTYSALSGGTIGIAYAGRCLCLTGSQGLVVGAMRDGIFGNDGSSRANLGIVNEGPGPTDVLVSYFDGANGALLKQFIISGAPGRAGRVLEENEVYQLNNIFSDSAIPLSTLTLVVEVTGTVPGVYVSAYGVQLDNATNDGSFFFFEEE